MSPEPVKPTIDNGMLAAGVKQERSSPREIEGKQVLFVLSLPPRTICDALSEGMLFDFGHADGLVPVLVVPERAVPNGGRVG